MKFSLACGCGLAALVLALGTVPATAQALQSFAPASTPKEQAWLSGIWVKVGDPKGAVGEAADSLYSRQTVMTDADGKPVPFRPGPLAIVEKRLKDAAAGHPYASTQARCLPPGVPDMMFEFGLMEFLQTPGQVTVLRQEFGFYRVIPLSGKHPADPDPTFMGNSVGHWEGGALVVDTIGLTEKTGIRFIIPHTEDLHLVERYSLLPNGNMQIRATVEDPKIFTRPWDMVTELHRLDGGLTEYICENNRNGVDAQGNETSIMPGVSH